MFTLVCVCVCGVCVCVCMHAARFYAVILVHLPWNSHSWTKFNSHTLIARDRQSAMQL